jgi:hypothetical protein
MRPTIAAALLTTTLLVGCAPAAETTTGERADAIAIDRSGFDERMAPLEAFLDLRDVYVTSFREVVPSPSVLAQSEYEIHVRVRGEPSVLRALVFDSAAEARSSARVLTRASRGDVPPRGGRGTVRRHPVYRSGAVVVLAPPGRGMLVHQRLRDAFGRAQPD